MDKAKTGSVIKEARIKKGYTQQELGDLVGVTNKAVSRWEKAESFPDIAILEQLAKALDLNVDELILGKKELSAPTALESGKVRPKCFHMEKRGVILSAAFLAVMLLGTFYFGRIYQEKRELKGRNITTYANVDPLQKQKYDKELELTKAIRAYDKDNIVKTSIYIWDLEGRIAGANLLIVSWDEITDPVKQNEISSLVSENLNVDSNDIEIVYMDTETFNSPKELN